MCKKEVARPEVYWGEASAELNGQHWSAKIRGAKSTTGGIEQKPVLNIVLDRFNQDDILRESLYLFKIPNRKGQYKIYQTIANTEADTTGVFYATVEDDGDVILDIYHLNETDSAHFVQITAYDAKTTIVEGTFQVSLIRDATRPKRHPSILDTIRFTNGRFKTKILVKR
jgi:hypothetical protein